MDLAVSGMNIAILVTDGFEQSELTEPRKALEAEGAFTRIVSDRYDKVRSTNQGQQGEEFIVDLFLQEADAKAFDAILLPGGKLSAASLRNMGEAQRFVQNFEADHKPVCAIAHGAALLVSAGLVEGCSLTSDPELEQEISAAGGNWRDEGVVKDGNLVSCRSIHDIPAFNEKMIEAISARMLANLRGKADEHAVGIAGS